jgi:hypothetical protein
MDPSYRRGYRESEDDIFVIFFATTQIVLVVVPERSCHEPSGLKYFLDTRCSGNDEI